jgi:acyl-CoA synthetase (AMP-forming)/AMP-acid ligase II
VRGYWNRPAETSEAFTDGWFHTGDLGYIDADGYVYVVDRLKDVVIRGGENVYCAEVENVLFQHPAVFDAAVIGLPDPVLGKRSQRSSSHGRGSGRTRTISVRSPRSGSPSSRCRPGSCCSTNHCPATQSARCSSESCAASSWTPTEGAWRARVHVFCATIPPSTTRTAPLQ